MHRRYCNREEKIISPLHTLTHIPTFKYLNFWGLHTEGQDGNILKMCSQHKPRVVSYRKNVLPFIAISGKERHGMELGPAIH